MVDKIFTNTDIPYKETRFNKAPSTTYAIYTDSINRRGGDTKNLLVDHRIFIELYSGSLDLVSEGKLERNLDAFVVQYNKSERVWLEDEQKYQVIYDFNYTEKRRI